MAAAQRSTSADAAETSRQLDSPLLPKIFKYAGKVHVRVYRRTDGKIGGMWRIGAAEHPQWYRNLVADPDTHIEIGPDRRAVHAVTANPEERARLWPKLVEVYADFENYQSWTDREIPVVVLKPR